ncbi:MAG: hypothetical protein J5830_00490, partial [Clostridia bacterium]|nr:hypothetical protein [Clostridia bacterium]
MKELNIIRKKYASAEVPERSAVYPPGVSAKAPKRGGNGRLAIELAAGGVLLFVMVLAVAIGPGLIRKDYVEPGVTGENSGTADDTTVIDETTTAAPPPSAESIDDKYWGNKGHYGIGTL